MGKGGGICSRGPGVISALGGFQYKPILGETFLDECAVMIESVIFVP